MQNPGRLQMKKKKKETSLFGGGQQQKTNLERFASLGSSLALHCETAEPNFYISLLKKICI